MSFKAWPVLGGAPDDAAFSEVERDAPELRPRDVLVRVRAVSVNPVDTKVRTGVKAGTSKQLGYDAAGVVEAVGSEAQLFAVGDEVYYAGDITRDGTNAELHAVDERIVGRKPASLSWEEAAALPLTSITAWESLFEHLRIRPDDQGQLLVVGAAGGVGSMMVQLAKALTPGVEVIATAGRGESQEWVRHLGADRVIGRGDLLGDVGSLAPSGVRWIFSPYTRGNLETYAALLQTFGAVVAIDEPEGLETLPLKAKSAALHWENMFARIVNGAHDVGEQGRLLTRVAQLIDAKELRTTLTRTFDGPVAESLQQAHSLVASGGSIGKAAVRLPSS